MTNEQVINTMKGRDFTFTMEAKDGRGSTICLYFLSEEVPDSRHKEKVLVPSYTCTVYPETGEFEFSYMVPHSANKLVSPKCGSVELEEHFNSIAAKFETAVQVLHRYMA